MTAFGPYLSGCLLLLLAGAAKLVRPHDTARALALRTGRGSLRGWSAAVRSGGAVELVLGAGAAAMPGRPLALAVAGSYAAFALYVADARRRGGPLATCGCFGDPDTPATALHLMANMGLALAAGLVAFARPAATLPAVLAHEPFDGVPLLAAAIVLTGLFLVALTAAARLQGVRTRSSALAATVVTPGPDRSPG
ncbi:MAG TPA: MauE/DoxX family redox-associated membrane protein [Acidimicrobiales bacterium]|nr:MauE/DoxX family redox-associated membrane protein [Acidimicrobiales bacterium]